MSIYDGDVKIRQDEGETSPSNKTERPPLYNVIIHQKGANGNINACVACVLTAVFNKHPIEAITHAINVGGHGSDVVYTSTREAAETKAEQGNAEKKNRGFICNFKLRKVSFTTEPSP